MLNGRELLTPVRIRTVAGQGVEVGGSLKDTR